MDPVKEFVLKIILDWEADTGNSLPIADRNLLVERVQEMAISVPFSRMSDLNAETGVPAE